MITGSIAYNQNRSSIYISDIVYCGEPEPTLYSKIDCGLYEVESNVETMISSCDYKGLELITIDDFLKDITIHAENYERTCKEYSSNSLFLEIGATDIKGKTTTYKIPLQLEGNCHSYQNNS